MEISYLFYISEQQVIIFVNETFDVVCHIPSIMLQSEFLEEKRHPKFALYVKASFSPCFETQAIML